MPFHSASKQPRHCDMVVLWTVVWLFVALGLSWAIYPRVYAHYHYHSHAPSRWSQETTRVFSHTFKCLLLASAVGFLGFVQLHFRKWFMRDASRVLFRVFLGSSAVVLGGACFLAFTTHFWTSSPEPRANEILAHTGAISIFFLKFGFGVAVLNFLVSSFHKREV